MTNRLCPRCKNTKAIEEFGKGRWCLRCTADADADRREINRRKNLADRVSVSEKFCPSCKKTLPALQFNKNYSRSDGLVTYCRDCRRSRNAAIQRKRNSSSPKHNIDNRVACGIRDALKRGYPAASVFESLGYNAEQLRRHLLSTLPDGFSWDDFLIARLEIDHHRPRCLFEYDSTDSPAFLECWALSNLRLIPKEDNNAKLRDDYGEKRTNRAREAS